VDHLGSFSGMAWVVRWSGLGSFVEWLGCFRGERGRKEDGGSLSLGSDSQLSRALGFRV
jgi:hypothetical protein